MPTKQPVEDHSQHISLRLVHGYEFVAEFSDVADSPRILLDEPPPLGEGRRPNAAAILGAAVGNCLAASLTYCLRRSRIDVAGLAAHVAVKIGRNEKGRMRIDGIDVNLEPDVKDGDLTRFERCEELFEDFCTVTASIRKGIPVNVTVKQPAAAEV